MRYVKGIVPITSIITIPELLLTVLCLMLRGFVPREVTSIIGNIWAIPRGPLTMSLQVYKICAI